MTMLQSDKKEKIRYGFKKFILYLLIALPACNIPIPWLGLIFGLPAVVLTALFLAIYDGLHVDLQRIPPVFTHAMWLLWAVEIAIIVTCIILFYVLFGK